MLTAVTVIIKNNMGREVTFQSSKTGQTICDVAHRRGDFAYDDNFELIIYSVRAVPKLQNDPLFIEIDQCKQAL